MLDSLLPPAIPPVSARESLSQVDRENTVVAQYTGPTRYVSRLVNGEWFVYDLRVESVVEGPFATNDLAMNACAPWYNKAAVTIHRTCECCGTRFTLIDPTEVEIEYQESCDTCDREAGSCCWYNASM
ncbi:MAG TPA: hypothetical protein VFK94_02135 [Patescibacteria group bacterium]|nr:hypothetical protein [Patescibacteria group bacterium]